ncbi:dihydropteroate synthase [Riemerella columbipharyngis]|uniref:Dihydropteroate synthase n=1 Tax=Riemerella columbipharyngis TaxID=1071918 RepID=A0A1G7BTJ1_9FLAO|nr:dihydropteroate synthase [Riemerella columbipharyngis]SDE30282.1 dihydropteroate synthase [Riemerella columbipharyngis]
MEKRFSINCRGRLLDLSKPKIMGILNVTPDSFSDGGRFNNEKAALCQAEKMLEDGAEIIDIGAQSTRPNAQYLSANEEIKRIRNIISELKKEFPHCYISLDTFYSAVVRFGADEGIDIVNDISGGQFDADMFGTVAETQLPYILMHCNPDYKTMHEKIAYENIVYSINRYFSDKLAELKAQGVYDVILDPGFGFGKTIENQIQMIEEIEYIGLGNYPVLAGISKKSFIYKPLGKSPNTIATETQKLHKTLLEKGVRILRVHDIAETKNVIDELFQDNC